MLSVRTLAAAAAGLLPLAGAYITSVVVPATAHAGDTIQATLTTSIYVQNYDDFGVIWGVGPPQPLCPECVGRLIGYTNLVGEGAPTVPASGNFTVDVTLPPDLHAGSVGITAGIPFLVGASGETGIKYLNASIVIS
ncbi:hypothetical protein VTK73DRAFT_2682 [Phialemonium thermophilum]|uniref:Uncharacterized protein n=1 Tax=Phialemonium thermophilum TaxID=223376 RepID=A0ABR3VQ21_9PEZI